VSIHYLWCLHLRPHIDTPYLSGIILWKSGAPLDNKSNMNSFSIATSKPQRHGRLVKLIRCNYKRVERICITLFDSAGTEYSVHSLDVPTIGTLDPIGHGHSIASNILAAFGNPVLSCKHSGESPFQLS